MPGSPYPGAPVRVIVVANNGTAAAALQQCIEANPGISIVAYMDDIGAALDYCERDRVDVVVADVTGGARMPPPVKLAALSTREREVFQLLVTGPSNRQLSRSLGITERTVKAHIGSIMAKLGLESRLQVGLAAALYHAGEARALQPSGPLR